MKNPNDPIGNQTRALPVRSANPKKTAYSAGGAQNTGNIVQL
jgi:hypothetical protein